MLPANTAGADPWHGHAPTESFCIHPSFGYPLGQGTHCGRHRLSRWQSPVIWWRQHPDAIVLQGIAHLVDPRTHCSMGRYREHHAKEHSHEHQRQKHPSCTMRLSIYPRPSLAVQALQVLYPWILRHPRCSWPLSCGRLFACRRPRRHTQDTGFGATREQTVRRSASAFLLGRRGLRPRRRVWYPGAIEGA